MSNFFDSGDQPLWKDSAFYRRQGRIALRFSTGMAILVYVIYMLITNGVSQLFSVNTEDFLNPNYTNALNAYYSSGDQSVLDDLLEELDPLLAGNDIAGVLNFFVSDWNALYRAVGILSAVSFVISLIIASPLKVGLWRFFLGMCDQDSETVRIGTLFSGFRTSWTQSVLLSLLQDLVMVVSFVPTVLPLILLVWCSTFLQSGIVLDVLTVLVFVGMAVTCILAIVFGLGMAFSYTVLADHPEMNALEALRESFRIMKGNKWKYFCLTFSFIGWILLFSCCCSIGMIWLMPYMLCTEAFFYCDIVSRSLKSNYSRTFRSDDYIIR